VEWSSPSIIIGIGLVDRFEQFACTGQKIVMDILRKEKDVENNLGKENRQNLHVFNLWPVKYHTK
jgi:hypothetical protein